MSKKIKEIDICAFRAYKNLQKFDFVHRESGNVADMIAIYAPNGYGKTSFFDAVEWALTGEIGRFKSSKSIEEAVRDEESYILKNKDADGKYGSVKIIDEDNHVIQINTKKKKGNMKGDYKTGEIEIISPELQSVLNEKDRFCTTNLLAHDKITGFLQNYTAKGKTNELRVMWDENRYSEVLDEVTVLYNELQKKIRQLEIDIDREEKEINKYKYENFQISKLEKLLIGYREKHNFNLLLSDTLSIEDILVDFENVYKQSQMEKEEKRAEINTNDLLIIDYEEFTTDKKMKVEKERDKKACENESSIWESIENDEKGKERLVKKYREIAGILNKIEEFFEYVKRIGIETAEGNNAEKEVLNLQKKKIEIGEQIQSLDARIVKSRELLEELQKEYMQIQEDFSQYTSYEKERKRYERLTQKARHALNLRQKRKKDEATFIQQLELFQKKEIKADSLGELVTDKIKEDYNFLQKIKDERETLQENSMLLEASKEDIIKLLNKIEQLLVLGKEVVIENHQQECPLCHMHYKDSDELMMKISEEKKENDELKNVEELIEKNRKRLEILEAIILEKEEKIKTEISKIFDNHTQKYIKENHKITLLELLIENGDAIVARAENICGVYEEKYKIHGIDISEMDSVRNGEYRITQKKTEIKEKIELWNNELESKNKSLEKINNDIKENEIKRIEKKEEISKIKERPLYLEVEGFLAERMDIKQTYTYDEVKEMLEHEINELERTVNEISVRIAEYQKKISGNKYECEKKLRELQNVIINLDVKIEAYLLRFRNVISESIEENEMLDCLKRNKEKLQVEQKKAEEKILLENEILSLLRNLKEQTAWLNRRQLCEQQKSKLKLLNGRLEKLAISKKFVEEFIVKRTNECFDSEIINQIYNKIDPHPTMKHIKFITNADKDGLKTHIYTYDETEESKMAPVVYLSSAQVNILSLCIFLAKVLVEKNTTFNTIFMDDPIQHLDGINLLAFIDILRTITTDMGRQIIISTHNEQFYQLLKVKMDDKYYPSRFIELSSTGVIK